jgi:hypothetical protein
LLGIVGYATIVGYYIAGSSWAAPFTVNSSDTQVLAILSQITTSQATLAALQLDLSQTEENSKFSKSQLASLTKLERNFDSTTQDQREVWDKSARDLQQFDNEAQKSIAELQQDVKQNEELRVIIGKDLKAGLMTKADAATAISSIDNLANTTVSSQVAETTLVDNVRQHQMIDISSLSVEEQRAQVAFQIGQLESAIKVDNEHAATDQKMMSIINTAINTARLSPYYVAVNSPATVQLAVVPYNGNNQFKAGEPVYECAFGMVICHYVGTVMTTYANEQVFENPLTKTNLRGYLLRLDVSAVATRSKSLIIGHKPLLF